VSCSRIICSPPPAVGLTRCSQAQRPPWLPRPCRAQLQPPPPAPIQNNAHCLP
jgi:hypothetical protein